MLPLAQLQIEIGVGEAVLSPVRLDDDIVNLRDQLRVPVAAPGTFGKQRGAIGGELIFRRIAPPVVIPLRQRRCGT